MSNNFTPSRFPSITAGAVTITDHSLTISSGKQFFLGGDATEANQAVTKSQLDALQTQLNLIAGGDEESNTLPELRSILEAAQESGVSNLAESINSVSDRLTAEVTARSDDVSGLEERIGEEESARATAVSDLQTSISNEVTARSNDVSGLQTSISNEEEARVAAVQALSNKIFRPVMVPLSGLVVPDESQPLPMTVAIKNAAGLDGWYFKNGGSASANGTFEVGGRKINWYFGAPTDSSGVATGDSLIELDMCVRIINKVSPPFVTVYTKPKVGGIGAYPKNAASWYNARYTYIVNNTSSLVNNTNYLFRARPNGGSAVGSFAGFTPVDLTLDTFSSTANATLLPTDEILAISIGSDSSSSAGNVEFIQHSLGIYSTNGNTLYLFSNDPIATRYLKHKISDLYVSLGQSAPLDV